jgi:hypothetical protein
VGTDFLISNSQENSVRYHECKKGVLGKYLLIMPHFNLPEFSQHIFKTRSNIKFRESMSSRSKVIPYRWAYMTRLIVTLHNIGYVPKK